MNISKKYIYYYAVADYFAAALSWLLFLVFRKRTADVLPLNDIIGKISKHDYLNIFLLIPLGWLLLHLLSGAYFTVFRKSRLNEMVRTLLITLIGGIGIFFLIVVNDHASNYGYYGNAFFTFVVIQFLCTALLRNAVLVAAKKMLQSGGVSFNALMIGGNKEAIKIFKEISENTKEKFHQFKGFVYADDSGENGMSNFLPKLGSIQALDNIIDEHCIDEVVIAIDTEQHYRLQEILTRLSMRPTVIKISPDMYDIISGSVRTNNILGTAMIDIYPELMPDWQRVVKRALDIVVSVLVLLLLLPVYIVVGMLVKLGSKGSVFYSQERIGLYGKPFFIHKFRSMVANAEQHGPALSSETDARITQWGKVMRKWRLDELPQFFNILKGNMSLVGPRPERQFFIDEICKTHAHYKYLHRVKPGLTSWGMVKYGYAENVEQMKERMKYDLLYIKNCSLALDTKIMIYTVLVILQGRGK